MRLAIFTSLIAIVMGVTLSDVEAKILTCGDSQCSLISIYNQDFSARRKVKRRGACDGFRRCRCGVTAARKAGLPLNYNGHNLKRAVEWIKAFPRTSIHAGAVGYVRKGGPSGHVFTVVNYNGGSMATVYDDRGTYERRIDNAVFVNPGGRVVSQITDRMAAY